MELIGITGGYKIELKRGIKDDCLVFWLSHLLGNMGKPGEQTINRTKDAAKYEMPIRLSLKWQGK